MKKIVDKFELLCYYIKAVCERYKLSSKKNLKILKKFEKTVDKLEGFCYNETPPAKSGRTQKLNLEN